MKHETARELLLDLAYGELPAREAREVEAHAGGCAECRDALRLIRETRGMMAALPPEPAPEEGERILLAAAREAARARADRRRARLVPPWLWGGSIAAVAALVVAVVSYRISAMHPGPLGREDRDVLLGSAPQAEPAAAAPSGPPSPRPSPPARAGGEGESASALAPGASSLSTAEREGGPSTAEREGGPSTTEREEGPSSLGKKSPLSPTGGEGKGEGAAPARAAPAPAPSAEKKSVKPAPPAAESPPAPAPSPAAAAPERRRAISAAPEPDAAADGFVRAERGAQADDLSAPRAPAAPGPAFAEPPPPAPAPRAAAPSRASKSAAAPSAAPGQAPPVSTGAALAADDALARWQELRAAGRLRGAIATFPGCEGESWRKVEQDPQGRVVKYARHGAAGGVPFEAELYYAADGALRLVRYREEGGPWREARLPGSSAPVRLEGIPPGVVAPLRAADAGIEAPGRCLP